LIEVKKISSDVWESMKSDAHIGVFGELSGTEKVDFALLTVNKETDEIIQYVTVREYDATSIHWYYGGSFEKFKGSVMAYKSMEALLAWAKEHYKKLSFLTANTNFPMIKFGTKHKFQITGMRLVKDGLLLEHVLEFNKENQ